MFARLFFIFLLTLSVSCSRSLPKTYISRDIPVPIQLKQQTVALLAENGKNEWHTYCAGVWVSPRLFLTAYHCAAFAKIMSMPELDREKAEEQGNKLDVVGAPISYGIDTSFSGELYASASEHFPAIVVAADGQHDLALIQVEGWAPDHRSAPIATIDPEVGDEICIMGHPSSVQYTFARGYVSAYRKDISQDQVDIHGPFIQINVGISGGNSGGGVFNSQGELVGIISFMSGRMVSQGFTISLPPIQDTINHYGASQKQASRTNSSAH